MSCYQRLGRRRDALAVYRRCRDVLGRELGVEPSPEMDSMYRTLGGT